MQKQISHFKILDEIGSGGMGVVYRARDLRLRRSVALKVLPAGAFAEPMIRERLMREAQTASSLNHPHIVTVFEIHSAGDRDFIAMEFVEGQSLDRLIGDEGLPLEQALRYGIQIADGLSCAHEHGVIHRDLKPQNVMITPSDGVKILDFGLAKRFVPLGFEAAADNSSLHPGLVTLTAPGVKVGTPAYMSPEQIESRPIDARSDIFSFGCLLYQMLTGVTPFSRRNAILIFKAVLSDQPESLRSLKPKLPVRLEKILSRAMEKVPEDRYQSMDELLAQLESLHDALYGTGIHALRSGNIPAPIVPRRSRPWQLALTLAGIAAAVILIWFVFATSRPPTLTNHRLISALPGYQASFSPTGDEITFVGRDRDGVAQIWTQSMMGGLPVQRTMEGFASEGPLWLTPNRLLFGVHGAGIWSASLDSDDQPSQFLELGSNLRLDHNRRQLVMEHQGDIWLVDAGGNDLELASAIPTAFFARWVARSPAFSPDGQSLVYFQPEVGSVGSLWVSPVVGGQPRRLVESSFSGGDPVWTPDGRWIVFSADLAGETNLWCVSAQGGKPRRLTREAGRHTEPALAPDGQKLVYTLSYPSFSLRIRPADGSSDKVLFESHFEIVMPTVSPDGERVAFFSPAGRAVHIFVIGIDGQGLRQVTQGEGEKNLLPQWSADGSSLYFYQEQPSASFRVVAQGGGESHEVLSGWSLKTHYDTAVDPSGQRVVYTPLTMGKPGGLRVRDLDSDQEQRLTVSLRSPRWSPSGGLILGSDDNDRIVLCSVSGATCRDLVDGLYPRWQPDGDSITFVHRAAVNSRHNVIEVELRGLQLESLEQRSIAVISALGPLSFGYDLLSDGSVIWNHLDAGRSELWMADVN